jgi:hypothetical protein
MRNLSSVFGLALPDISGAMFRPELIQSSCDALLREAVRLGVFAAVYSNLREAGQQPRDEKWRRRFQVSGARNLFLKREQERVLTGLREASVVCLPVRGIALTETLYPDVFWREIVDIDLLIAPQDVSRAYRVLKEMGLSDREDPWTEGALARLARRGQYHYPEIRMTGKHAVAVELHWDWVEPRLPAEDLFSDTEGYLVYLCRHAGKHFWCDVRWLADIELFLRQQGATLDWDRFWRLARTVGATRGCAGSLELCGRLFPREQGRRYSAPPRLTEHRGRRLARQAEKWLIGGEWSAFWHHPAMQLLRVDTPLQRLRRICSWLTPAPRHWNRPDGSIPSMGEVWVHRYRSLALRGAAAICPSLNWRRRLTRVAEWSSRDWTVLLVAWYLLPVVAVGVRLRRFPRTREWAARVRAVDPPNRSKQRASQVGALVKVAAQRHIGRFACLPRSLTLLRLLGREGIRAELRLGVRHGNGTVEGHAWVEHEGVAVNEPGDPSSDYGLLRGARAEPSPEPSRKSGHSIRSSN